MSSTTLEHCIRYSGAEEKELSMCFNFHHLKVDYKDGNKWELMEPDYMELKVIFEKWQMGMQRGNAIMISLVSYHVLETKGNIGKNQQRCLPV